MTGILYIVDGYALIYRAYYAFINRPLMTTKGENTSAIFGFMRMLLKLIQDESPEYLVCAFDSKGKTFRHEKFPEYKAKRLKAPEDLHRQADTIRILMDKLGISQVQVEGYEADDLIGALCEKAKSSGIETIILSGDKDILQLVDESVTVYANKKGISEIEKLDSKRVEEVWGVPPERIVDLLSLMGDQSDNVPGVRGIGKAFALKLIQEFENLDNLYNHLDDVEKERIRNILREGKEDAFLSRELVTISRDAPINFNLKNYRIDKFPEKEGIELLALKELNSVVNDLKNLMRGSLPAETFPELELPPETKRGNYFLLNSMEEYKRLEERIRKKGEFSFDTESTGRDPLSARIIGVSISVDEGEGYYIPIVSREGSALGEEFLRTELKGILEDSSIEKKGQNIKYDFLILQKYGISIRGITGDSMIAAYLLNPQKQRYSLDDLAKEYLDYRTIHYSDIVKDKNGTLLDYSLEKVVDYAGEDSDIALRLVHLLEKKLEEEELLSLYHEIEIPLLQVLGRMESAGVRIDPEYLGSMSEEFAGEIKVIEDTIFSLAGEEFNVRSTKQLARILFEKLKLPAVKKTKTGYSTDESVLEELSQDYDIARLLLRHRTLTKLKSTYLDSLPALINERTGRIHTSFNQTIASTGRLSSNTPNLQNIPIREKEGKAIRRAFVPEDGWLLVSADYSQIELRILASLSSDEALVNAFRQERDIHSETASLLFGVDAAQVQDFQRQMAKTINFSIIYGITPFGLSKRLKISRKEAANFIDMYFLKYGGVKKYFTTVVESVKEKGYAETLLGRKRYIPEIHSENRNIYEAAQRIAINTPIQGTAADLIKKAMVMIDAQILRSHMKSRMLIQVHDELVFESPREECDTLKKLVKETMENALVFNVPIEVNVSVGKNWEEAH